MKITCNSCSTSYDQERIEGTTWPPPCCGACGSADIVRVTAEWACLACGGPVVPMGALGQLDHGRCRNCGITQSRTHEPEEDCADCGCSLHDEFNRDGYSHMGESPRCKRCFDAHCFGQLPEDA